MEIPKVLHQLVLNRELISSPLDCRPSWRRWNPGLHMRLWTFSRLRVLLAARQSGLLPLWDALATGMGAALMGRYLVLQHYGGIVTDLDCQCLQSVAPLLEGRALVIAEDPQACRSASPNFLASVPRHPLWSQLFKALARVDPTALVSEQAVTETLGSGLLNRLLEAGWSDGEGLLPSQLFYPFTPADCRDGRSFDPVNWSDRCKQAYVVHHSLGSQLRPERVLHAGIPAHALVNVQELNVDKARELQGSEPEPELPLISALMVTRNRLRQAQLAIQTFRAQTYLNRELVVVDDDPDPSLARWISAHADPQIRLVRLPDAQQPLGALRNLALEQARGLYVCQWDDDDLYDPVRLEVQLKTLRASGAQASLLARWMIWWPHHQRLALSCYRNWEGSLLCRRSLMPTYPCLRRGEDSLLLEELSNSVRLARIDMPRLYLYIVHGMNTFEQQHFEAHWQQATARWQGPELERLLPELQRRLPIDAYRQILAWPEPGEPQPCA